MSGVFMELHISASVSSSLKHQLKQEIIDSTHEDKALRREMMKTFKLANDRIRNLEKAGVVSPALAHIEGRFYSSPSWFTMKTRYAEAIAFLNQPTSTVRGSRSFKKFLQEKSGLKDKPDLFEAVYQNIASNFISVADEFTANLNYKDIIQMMYDEAAQAAGSQIEQQARADADALERSIEQQAESIAGGIVSVLDKAARDIVNSFATLE